MLRFVCFLNDVSRDRKHLHVYWVLSSGLYKKKRRRKRKRKLPALVLVWYVMFCGLGGSKHRFSVRSNDCVCKLHFISYYHNIII